MKNLIPQAARCLPLALALCMAFPAPARAESKPGPKLRIVLVGDSTVAPEGGWGNAFGRLLSPDTDCINMARNGRSSKSFRDQGLWKKALEAKPDYIFIQFGHNDMPNKGPERATDPNTSYRENMIRYVEEARANGSKPVLVASMSRRQFGKDGKIHSDLAPYVEAVKKVASEKQTPLIDLHTRSIELYEKLGKAECEKQLSPFNAEKGTYDGTHFTPNGGEILAGLVADEVRKTIPELAARLQPPQAGECPKTSTPQIQPAPNPAK